MPDGALPDPLRVAVIGSGPSAFYTVEALLAERAAEVDIFERLPTPYGLVRYGVAPDHPRIKSVTRVFERIATDARVRFFGKVEFGSDVTLDDLVAHYHQIVFATGAQGDRTLGIPGEDLDGSHAATDFVAWYNGHPDHAHSEYGLGARAAAVIGVGNVALDVARILCLTRNELAASDMPDGPRAALGNSAIEDVYVLGRRGPAQAAFTTPELKELGELEGADLVIDPAEVALDDASAAELDRTGDRVARRNVTLLQELAERAPEGKPRRLHLRFLASPTAIGGENGSVESLTLARNRLLRTETGTLRPEPTGDEETIPLGLVFRAVGYRGTPLSGVPFDERWAVIRNERGRVLDGEGMPVTGLYTAGWIKRGPSGVIGTNKPDAQETVDAMLEDARGGRTLAPGRASAEAALALVCDRMPAFVSFEDWQRIDAIELERGEAQGRPRAKFTTVEAMEAALGR